MDEENPVLDEFFLTGLTNIILVFLNSVWTWLLVSTLNTTQELKETSRIVAHKTVDKRTPNTNVQLLLRQEYYRYHHWWSSFGVIQSKFCFLDTSKYVRPNQAFKNSSVIIYVILSYGKMRALN